MPIKLTKAIEILTREVHDITLSPDPDVPAALKLSIAGLKAIHFVRNGGRWDFKALLPGEQPEEIVKGG